MRAMIIDLFTSLFIRLSSNDIDLRMCEMLCKRHTEEFENREADMGARDGHRALKLAERRRAKAEKKLKRTRDETASEKAQR